MKNRPICPECHQPTIVAFTPPKEGIVGTPEGYRLLGSVDYVDWEKAHLYCCNATANCKYEVKIFRGLELSTP